MTYLNASGVSNSVNRAQHIPTSVVNVSWRQTHYVVDFPFMGLQRLCMNKGVTERVEGREEGRGMDLEKLCNCWREGINRREGARGENGTDATDYPFCGFPFAVCERVIQLFHFRLLSFLPGNILTIFSSICPTYRHQKSMVPSLSDLNNILFISLYQCCQSIKIFNHD